MKKLVSTLLIISLLTVCLGTLAGCTEPKPDPVVGEPTRMTVDINPSLEFIVDAENKVVSVTALNDDGAILIAGEAFIGLSAEEAAQLAVELATETGYLVKGDAELNENNVKISLSGDGEYIEALTESVKQSAKQTLARLEVKVEVEQIEAMKLDALRTYVQQNTALTEEEVLALDEQQLLDALKLSRIETAELLTEDLRAAYLEAKNYEISIVEREQTAKILETAGGLYAIFAAGYSSALATYRDSIAAIEQARYDYLVSPDSDYQKALSALREKKGEYLEKRSVVATVSVGDEQYATLRAELTLSEQQYDQALATLESLGAAANAVIDSAIAAMGIVEAQLVAIEEQLPENFDALLLENAAALETALNEAKDSFFAEFEAQHAQDIAAAEAELLARKEALKASISATEAPAE